MTADFRAVASDASQSRTGSAQLAVTAAFVLPAWIALAVAAIVMPSSQPGAVSPHASTTILSILSGELAVGAAVVSIMRASAARELAPAFAGAAFLAYGVHKLLQLSSGTSSGPGSASQVLANASLVLAFGLVLLSVVQRPEARRGHPLNLWVGALILALVALAIARPAGSGILSDTGSAGTAGSLVVTGAWGVLGLAAIYVGRTEQDLLKIWIGFTALCLGQARLALVLIGDPALSALASGVLETIAIALVLLGTVDALQETIARNNGLIRDSILAFQGSETRRRNEAHAHEEAVHNLRSALTSIGTATHLLVSNRGGPLGDDERGKLVAALQSELDRARRLLSREWDGERRPFPLRDVLTPLAVNERSQGAVIETLAPHDTTVVGNPERTYEVLATLFDNARRHAPGAKVTVRAATAHGSVTVLVEDRGPGLPPDLIDRIFERGWSMSAPGEGTGLGLFVARRLMKEQGGQLEARNRAGGGASFLLRFQAAEPVMIPATAPGPRRPGQPAANGIVPGNVDIATPGVRAS